MADLFALVIRRDETKFLSTGSWPASSDFAEYVTTYPAAFAEAMLQKSQQPRIYVIKLAEHHGATAAPEVETALVAMLTRPFDKNDRELAISALARLAPAQLEALLRRELPKVDIDARHGLVQAAGRSSGPEILALLEDRAKVEKAAKVKSAIQTVLESGVPSATVGGDGAEPGVASYTAVDGQTIVLPERIDLGSDDIHPPSDESCVAFVALVGKIEVAQRERHAEYLEKYPTRCPPSAPMAQI